MSLRAAILKAALPSLATTSFTRATLSSALRSLPDHSNLDDDAREAVLDTVFGTGVAGPLALVDEFEAEGARVMASAASVASGSSTEKLTRVLSARLAYSASVGEHLVEAHALLAASNPSSIPIPAPLLALLNAKLPSVPLYKPLPAAVASKAWEHGSKAAASVLDSTGGRLPLPNANPAAPLAYAWRVADSAVYAAQPNRGTGVMREPRGAGVEWYTSRAGIALAYLSAEAHLLQPYPAAIESAEETAPASTPFNPHLGAALSSLRHNIRRLDDMRGVATTLENAADSAIGFLELATRSVAGIIRSRGF